MPGFRVQKAASFIRDELILLLRDKVKDPRVKNLTVTEVSLTPDRRIARVYVANYGTEDELKEGLEGLKSAQGLLRREIAALLHWNFAPSLEFRVDSSWHYGQRIDALIDQISSEAGAAINEGDEDSTVENEVDDEDSAAQDASDDKEPGDGDK
ncbi:MAG: 30S ribosome-binding factor RbfA [Chloroflexi bacterium]|nr:30S ribosome-binding factor RbfA [Chloroflexota bacterium]